MIYAGIDTDTYPGDKTMEWLWDEKNSNLWWTGYYLPEKGSPQTWKGKYTFLRAMGWGVAPLYLGKQPRTVAGFGGKEKLEGYMDAVAATSMAARDEMPGGTVIYFDLEGGDIPGKKFQEYYKSWMTCVVERGYIPGLYCSYLTAPHMAKVMATVQGPPLIWAVRYHYGEKRRHKNPYPSDPPAGSFYPLASSWQLAGNSFITGPGGTTIKTDLDTSIFKDPGLRMA